MLCNRLLSSSLSSSLRIRYLSSSATSWMQPIGFDQHEAARVVASPLGFSSPKKIRQREQSFSEERMHEGSHRVLRRERSFSGERESNLIFENEDMTSYHQRMRKRYSCSSAYGQTNGYSPSQFSASGGANNAFLSSSAMGSSSSTSSSSSATTSSKIFSFLYSMNPLRPELATSRVALLEDEYTILEELGSGRYGVVRRAQRVSDQVEYAVKTISKSRVQGASMKELKNEIDLLGKLDHPNVMKLVETFEDRGRIHIISPIYSGGELFDRILQKHGPFSEREAAQLVKQLLEALRYCHSKNIVHRDIKPENLIFRNKHPDTSLVLVDFGLSTMYDRSSKSRPFLKMQCGSPSYVSPDVLKANYTEKTDIWSSGIILHILLCGFAPFQGKNDDEIMANVLKGEFSLSIPPWEKVSEEAKQLVRGMLTYDPEKRLSAEEALQSEWIRKNTTTTTTSAAAFSTPSQAAVVSGLPSPQQPKETAAAAAQKGSSTMAASTLMTMDLTEAVRNMEKYQKEKKLKKSIIGAIAKSLPPTFDVELEKLRLLFVSLDDAKTGAITVQKLKELLQKDNKISDPQELHKLFRALDEADTNADNSIDVDEFISEAMHMSLLLREETLIAAFMRFDKDRDGLLDRVELLEILNMDEGLVTAFLKDSDLNKDGKISFEEFSAAMTGKISSKN